MIERDFTLSGKPDEKQILEQQKKIWTKQEEIRIKKVAEISDHIERRKAETMLNYRDELLRGKKDESNQIIHNVGDEEVRKKVALRAELHIKPPRGTVHKTPIQREDFIRTQVRNNLGKKLNDDIKQVESVENKKIDQFVDKTLSKQRLQSKTKKQDFAKEAERVTRQRM